MGGGGGVSFSLEFLHFSRFPTKECYFIFVLGSYN